MRSFIRLACLIFIFISFHVSAQHRTELSPGYYVVVGAYAPSREGVAQKYTATLNRKGIEAAYGFNSSRNYFFVYLKYFTDLKSSLQEMVNARKQPEFADAWVRVISGVISDEPKPVASHTPVAKEFVNNAADNSLSENNIPVNTVGSHAGGETSLVIESVSASVETLEVTDNPPIKQYEKIDLGNTEVFLSLFNVQNNRIVAGNVKVIDTDRSKLIKEVKGNEYMYLPDPKSQSGQLTLICEAFGYRKIQQEISFPLPLVDTVKDYIDLMGTTFVINFDLIRYHRGDIATLYNVYFYNDAAVMIPESKYELNSLLEMMKENPKYRIRLHGHTNGNYHGKIITMGENKNFFSLEGSKHTLGSAKDLSYNRSLVIREFLGANGIDPSRVEIKAWGGKRPLYDKHGANARRNVRVEVEILED